LRKVQHRALRIVAIVTAAGLSFMAAGNFWEQNALTSFLFGATGVGLFIAIALLTLFGVKGKVSEADFDATINNAAQQIQSKEDKIK
jgi:hypothetical protein